ncbi:mercuric transport protein periplasmic component [Bradyrhizobium centrolobii]|uniref:Mercuric transport protein periplasmic component n=1 Tax=Bradyrhizobium centrolobii TaxID=1505087 RepID=A0A176YLA2_9BRAD|nr:cation transporter [Bradyrhizobium centrolobii]OAF07774.1 mercuric transport protein periplasmic component [Bradyrhizobium centrolobii]
MTRLATALIFAGALVAAPEAFAAERTTTFAIDNMTCASCPYIVKSSMAAVPGVAKVGVSFETKTATVIFDDAKTTAEAIAAAGTDAGYPAHVRQQGG